jgi:transposase
MPSNTNGIIILIQKYKKVLYLKSQALEHKEICRIRRISKTTLVTCLRKYQDGGIESLKLFGYPGDTSELDKHRQSLEDYFKEHPPRTIAEANQRVGRGQRGL